MSDIVLKPKPLALYKIWGAGRLAQAKGFPAQDKNGLTLGEVLEVSDLKNLETLILDEGPISYLFKLIDTSRPLSVQVHPGNEYAKRHEKSCGKSECWYILESQPDALIYLGLQPGVEHKDIQQTLDRGEDLSALMRSYRPKAGDFFTVPAGTIHAIGSGVTLAEVQQPSGVTYRFWDWERIGPDGKPRELHTRQAFEVLNIEDKSQFQHTQKLQEATLWQGPGFVVKKIKVSKASPYSLKVKKHSTIFALGNAVCSYLEGQNELGRWETLFINDEIQIGLAPSMDKEVQCLIIEPQ